MTGNDREIDIAAANMIERYGQKALTEIDLRVLELQSRDQAEALLLWREIRKRVKRLLEISTGCDRQH